MPLSPSRRPPRRTKPPATRRSIWQPGAARREEGKEPPGEDKAPGF